ncbi:glucose-1-phosphate adenylyltransferase [candidate division LCP-89 bacterium B3_LCP]|uniref:Glucose-1-phosphate adenylyltransferase n=1 Tax=candidate division LCP-89 bacterium B3_LCP TaxID=2012998 RepID=A0A532V5M1_UNCL8|nr:MAG: glucose-1-phosphate adenylyltransferase [candidate division LCP-89 bacterium B3_LCP]
MDFRRKLITLIMAGGRGERLYPLTKDRAKPAVSFGGDYRIIDFTLSNCFNSNLRAIYLLTQYRSMTLDRHVRQAWNLFKYELGEFIDSVPPQHLIANKWYEGTADSVYQNIHLLETHRPDLVLILSGDHIYKMNYAPLIEYHLENDSDLTATTVDMPADQSHRFGVLEMNRERRIVGFEEKPERGKPHPLKPDKILINMGVYVFDTKALVRGLIEDYKKDSNHDFGHDIIPRMIQKGERVFGYEFMDESSGKLRYWRDVGDIDSFYEANMDLVDVSPEFNLYDEDWPIYTYRLQGPPAKIIHESQDKRAAVSNSLLGTGVIISGAEVERSIISPMVRVSGNSQVTQSILMPGVQIGQNCRIKRTIIDEGVIVPDNTEIGINSDDDTRFFQISPKGIVTVPSGFVFLNSPDS